MAGAFCRPGHQKLHASSFQRMKEFRIVLVRQIVDCQHGFALHEWRQHVLSVENVRLYLGKQPGKNGANPYQWVFGDWNKVKRRTAYVFLAERGRMRIEKFILVLVC